VKPLRPGVTVVVPVHPPRLHSTLPAALASVWEQTVLPDSVVIAVDTGHDGAAATRNRGLWQVGTEWTAFLDSDDLLRPFHLEALLAHAQATGADLVYPWFDVIDGWDPFPDMEHAPFDGAMLAHRNYIPITVLVRTGLLRAAGGFRNLNDSLEPDASPCEDLGAWQALLAAGARFEHLDRRSWLWRWFRTASGDGNTSGRGDRW
jgi:glycosyltransferase involved in cell wall biosynthesis